MAQAIVLVTVAVACTPSEAGGPAISTTSTAPPVATPDRPSTTARTTTTTAPTSTTARPSTTATTTTTVPVDPPSARPLAVRGVSRGVSDSVVRLHLGLLGRLPS